MRCQVNSVRVITYEKWHCDDVVIYLWHHPVPSRQGRIRPVVGLVLRRADRVQADERQERARL